MNHHEEQPKPRLHLRNFRHCTGDVAAHSRHVEERALIPIIQHSDKQSVPKRGSVGSGLVTLLSETEVAPDATAFRY